MSHPRTRSASEPGVAAGTSWSSLLVRLFLIVLPAQAVGTLIGGQVVTPSAWSGTVISVISGVAAGLAVGLLLTPTPARRVWSLAVAAAFGVFARLLLLLLARLRAGDAFAVPVWGLLAGVGWVVIISTLVTWGLWVIKSTRV